MEIKIEKPCAEDWTGMTPDADGRFCSVCAKSVHDFTDKPKEELLEFLLCSTQSPCIRMLSSQENFTPAEVQTTAQRILHSGKTIPAAAMALVTLLAIGCGPSEADDSSTQSTNIRRTVGEAALVPPPPLTGAIRTISLNDSLEKKIPKINQKKAPTIKFRKPVPIKCGEEKVDDEHPSDMKEEEVLMGAPPQDLSIDYS